MLCRNFIFLLFILTFSLSAFGAKKVEVTIAISSSPNSLSPFFSTDSNSQNINRLIHGSLVDFNTKMELICRLCERYEESVDKQGKYSIDFKLKKDIFFQDGVKITAKHIFETWKLYTEDKKLRSIFRFAFKKITDVVIISDSEVKLKYDSFSMDALTNLTLLKILRLKHSNLSKVSVFDIVSSGEFKLVSVGPLETILESSTHRYIFKVVKDETTLVLKLLNGEVDFSVADISPRKISWLKSQKKSDLIFYSKPSSNYKYVGINHKNKHLKNLNFRKALNYLIPRDLIINYKLRNTVTKSSGVFSPSLPKWYTGILKTDYLPDRASKILLEAGYMKDSKGQLIKDGRRVELTFRVSSNKSSVEVVEVIKDYIERAGIKVNISVQEWGSYYRNIKKGNFDLFIGQWVGLSGPEILRHIFHSKSVPPKGANRGFFINPALDILLDDLVLNFSHNQKKDKILKVTEKINSSIPYFNLWHPNITWVGKKKVVSVKIYPNGSFLGLEDIQLK
jgi:peptide/nickel transport system substrate-binding protein